MKIKLTEILEFNNSNVRQDDGEKSGGLQVRGHLQEHTDSSGCAAASCVWWEGGWNGVLLQQLLAGFAAAFSSNLDATSMLLWQFRTQFISSSPVSKKVSYETNSIGFKKKTFENPYAHMIILIDLILSKVMEFQSTHFIGAG